jgi:molecular chaperone GrpE (heat shock protein)
VVYSGKNTIMKNNKIKIYGIFVLALWLLGIAGFCWVALDKNSEKTRLAKHEEVFNDEISKLDKIITGEESLSDLSESPVITNWQIELERSQKMDNSIRPLVTSAATGSIVLGVLIIISWGISVIYKSKVTTVTLQERSHLEDINKQKTEVISQPEKVTEKPQARKSSMAKKTHKGIAKVKHQPVTDILSNRSAYDFENINVMYCDEETANFGRRSEDAGNLNIKEKAFDQMEENIRNTIISGYNEQANKVDESLKAQSENLEKQVMELREMAESVKEAATEKPSTDDAVLSDLSQQISAIRDYASQQQNRNEKLQEGYDWNIIKNFCVRIIRCIDNIENRITRLASSDVDTAGLEDIRDELIFSLESSGVEQFTPEINSDYSGQEKYAEVTKEKVASNGNSVKGQIAEVIKPGYQYMIDEENIRVVRTAKVKLFE